MKCIRCGRVLKNPKCIAVGMGKVCQRKSQLEQGLFNSRVQGQLFRRVPRYSYRIEAVDNDRMLIRDTGAPWSEFMTVTNAAEYVVEELAPMLSGRRLFYIDSDGSTDELVVRDGKFAGFRFGGFVENGGEK